jgi:predicted lipase
LLKKYPSARILATGHSLGGALSVIAGLRLKAKFNVKVVVHNFGCPRIGNAAMAQFIFTRVDTIYRVVHNKDIVPHLPPEPLEYRHPAYEVFWN